MLGKIDAPCQELNSHLTITYGDKRCDNEQMKNYHFYTYKMILLFETFQINGLSHYLCSWLMFDVTDIFVNI